MNKVFDKLSTLTGAQKDKVEFYVMNAAGLAAGTGKSVMKLSAAKTLEKMVRITAVQLRMQGMAIVFRRQWKIPGLLEWMI